MTSSYFRRTAPIRFQDCDPAGIVYYPNFINRVEAAIEDWMGEVLGESYRHWIVEERRALPRVKVSCKFLKPCRMGELLELALFVVKLGRSSFEVAAEGRVEGELRLETNVVLVNMSLATFKAEPFAPDLRRKLEKYQKYQLLGVAEA
jgi:4-hydroxybenzoyl-CoA thioesterase